MALGASRVQVLAMVMRENLWGLAFGFAVGIPLTFFAVRPRLTITAPLCLIDLSTIALHRLGIERKYLIESSEKHYPESRQWATARYEQNPEAQGLC